MTTTTTARRTLFDLVDDAQGRVICLAMSKDPNAKVTVLLFRPGEDYPGYAAKVPTTAIAARQVQHEVMTLSSLDRKRLGALGETIPEVAEVAEHMGWPVLVSTALPGRVMLASYHQWRHTSRPASVKADFDAAGSWLAELHQNASSGQSSLAGMIDGVAADIAVRFGDDLVTAEDVERLLALQTRLDSQQAVRGLVHGDFWPGNLLTCDGQVRGVIDWENSRPDGLLTRDLARFAIAYSLYLDRHTRAGRRVRGHTGLRAGEWGAGLEYAINGVGWYPDLVHQFVAAGLQRLGVAQSCVRDVILAEIACIAAEADRPEFAESHLRLLRRLASTETP
jgi:aminoglycoside phosphotransferase